MTIWTAKKFKLPNMNFESTAIRFDDGRVGLCYHGKTIWQDAGGGWDESVGQDWQTVWKYGRLCSFNELPSDMRLTCPKCGHKVGLDDAECLYCGIILSKVSAEVQPTAAPVEEARVQEEAAKGRSRVVDVSLMALALIVVVGIVYYRLNRPEDPPPEPQVAVSTSAPQATPSQKARSDSEYDYSREEPVFQEKISAPEMPARPRPMPAAQPDPVIPGETGVSRDFYSHIDLNDRVGAHEALQVEIKKIEEERRQIQQDQERPMTMDENQALRLKMLQYNDKSAALQTLINDYKARYGE